jgi:hypothetical protein
MKTVDVTDNPQRMGEFLRQLSPLRQPVQLILKGKVIARLLPPDQISDSEKEEILQAGRLAVEKARARNRGLAEPEIGKIADAAVRRARSEQ